MTVNEMSINEMMKCLETNLSDEFKAITMYKDIADRIDDPAVLKQLSIVLIDEIKHLIRVSEQILKIRAQLVGLPGLSTTERRDIGIRDPLTSEEKINAYLAFLKEERIQQLRYSEQMEQTNDEEMKAVFKSIYEDEVKHTKIFQELLDNIGARI
jgi:rubrerythrin